MPGPVKLHSARELQHWAVIVDANGNLLASNIRVGRTPLTGRRLDQAQLTNSETSHLLVFHHADVAEILDNSCYVQVEGDFFVVDWLIDPQLPRHTMWMEVYCHIENGGAGPVTAADILLETGDAFFLENNSGNLILEG